jgi:hypothetical protein
MSEALAEEAAHPHPFRAAGAELMRVLPPLTLYATARLGLRPFLQNVAFAIGISAFAWLLIALLGSPTQWIALAIGVYAALSWTQCLAASDRAAFAMIFRSRTLRWLALGFPFIAFVTYGVGFWAPPYLLRAHEVDLAEAGTFLGLSAAAGGWIGVTAGGVIADALRRHTVNGRLYVGIAVPVLATPVAVLFLVTDSLWVAYACNFVFSIFSPMWVGAAASTVNDLVLPRMRAMASAFYLLMVTFIGLALGPFCIGALSDHFAATGLAPGDALRRAMLWGLGTLGIALVMLVGAVRHLGTEEANRLERARAAGEPV